MSEVRKQNPPIADAMAVAVLAVQWFVIVLVVRQVTVVPWEMGAGTFLALAAIGVVLWRDTRPASAAIPWRRVALFSLIVGAAFWGADLGLGRAHGGWNPMLSGGGLLGVPLSFFVFPCLTTVSVAGVAREFFLRKMRDRSGRAQSGR